MFRKLFAVVVCVSLLIIVSNAGNASGTLSSTISPIRPMNINPRVLGKTMGQWGAEWWKWAYSSPNGANPVQDETGEFCDANQPDGPVWFLAGSFGTTGVVRSCTIPEDKALFFPLVNGVWIDCPNSPDEDLEDEVVRSIMSTFSGDPACQLTCSVDGVAVSGLQIPAVRSQSPVFSIVLPENHIANAGCEPPLPPGETGRAIAEGHWVMLPALQPGAHTVQLHGALCDAGTGEVFFETGVTYYLTVTDDDDDADAD